MILNFSYLVSIDALVGKWRLQRRDDGGNGGVLTCVQILDTQLSCDGGLVTVEGATITRGNSTGNSTIATQGTYNGDKIITWNDGMYWEKEGKHNINYHN